jgi:predicted DNA-binding protein with PD1-like motif
MAKHGRLEDNQSMKYQRLDGNIWALRIMRGEEIVGSILQFANEEKLVSGIVTMIGAATDVELGFYDVGKKAYHWKMFTGDHEIVSATGNIALLNEKPFLHLHAVIGDAEYRTFGGHVKQALAGATTEVIIRAGELPLYRAMDPDIGLNLWKVE